MYQKLQIEISTTKKAISWLCYDKIFGKDILILNEHNKVSYRCLCNIEISREIPDNHKWDDDLLKYCTRLGLHPKYSGHVYEIIYK